jgi:hypothetical protein
VRLVPEESDGGLITLREPVPEYTTNRRRCENGAAVLRATMSSGRQSHQRLPVRIGSYRSERRLGQGRRLQAEATDRDMRTQHVPLRREAHAWAFD